MKLTFAQVKRLFDEINEDDIVDLEQGAGIKVTINNIHNFTPRMFEINEEGEEI